MLTISFPRPLIYFLSQHLHWLAARTCKHEVLIPEGKCCIVSITCIGRTNTQNILFKFRTQMACTDNVKTCLRDNARSGDFVHFSKTFAADIRVSKALLNYFFIVPNAHRVTSCYHNNLMCVCLENVQNKNIINIIDVRFF